MLIIQTYVIYIQSTWVLIHTIIELSKWVTMVLMVKENVWRFIVLINTFRVIISLIISLIISTHPICTKRKVQMRLIEM